MSNNTSTNELSEILLKLKESGLKKFGLVTLETVNKDLLEMLAPYASVLRQIDSLDKSSKRQWIQKQQNYDSDYYEKGVQTNKSGYENYQWMPELTMKMAHNMIIDLKIKRGTSVLDFGCAKGFLVKSLRMFDIDAYGVDVSAYAIQSVIPDMWKTHEKCRLIIDWKIPFRKKKFEWIIAKDSLEHLEEEELVMFLKFSKKHSKKIFAVVPLGKKTNGKERYIIKNYEGDVTHVIRKPPLWWKKMFEKHGWIIKDMLFRMHSIKENWTVPYPKGNGFFILEQH